MLKSKNIVPTIAKVMSEETGLPEAKVTADTIIPNNQGGFMVVARMANSIPQGGGVLTVSTPNMCSVGELAQQCVSEMERKAKELST